MEKLLERITGLIAATTIFIIVVSASHEFGYFLRLGRFFQTFATASDYFTNALLWIPIGIITAIGWWNYGFLWTEPPRPNRKDWKTWIVPTLILGPAIGTFVFTSGGFTAFYLFALVYLWFLFFDRWVPGASPDVPLSIEVRSLFKFAVPLCLAFMTLGYSTATSDVISTSDPYIFRLKDTSNAELRIPLRNFERGILTRDVINDRIEFVPWDNIKAIAKPESSGSPPLSCRWFGISCGTLPIIP